MTTTMKMAVSIPKAHFDQLESLAQRFNLTRSHLVEMAIKNFLENYQQQAFADEINQSAENQRTLHEGARLLDQEARSTSQISSEQITVNQGDIFWVPLEELSGAEADYTHPQVVIQENVLNRSRLQTVVVCALTSNLKRAKAPGNVLLEAGEANLPKQSVVVVSQVSTVAKTQLGEYIGTLTEHRITQILAGMQFVQLLTEHHAVDQEK